MVVAGRDVHPWIAREQPVVPVDGLALAEAVFKKPATAGGAQKTNKGPLHYCGGCCRGDGGNKIALVRVLPKLRTILWHRVVHERQRSANPVFLEEPAHPSNTKT